MNTEVAHTADPFETAREAGLADSFAELVRLPPSLAPAPIWPLVGASVATLCGFDLLGRPLLRSARIWPNETVSARSTMVLRPDVVNIEALLIFENGDPLLPIVIGLIQTPARATPEQDATCFVPDGQRTEIAAEQELTLRCGEASLTLTSAGKVLIQGTYVSSRSSGYNKIKGAAIEIN